MYDVQVSNSGRQQYLRAVFTKAGVYEIAVSVTDPVTGEALQIPSHGASQRLRITPGPVDPARTQIVDLPHTLTAGVQQPRPGQPTSSFSAIFPKNKHLYLCP